eukprot:CAMPEP_0177416490 /NCGR_PEP_ID=MMETSP0368-20130122/68130_1 /TAXON_ID=447022 ORGANISM="Scrippsiella hangoei-like, Strain SHHI-4" /NCGR_SAMPLE_ID=MMETSP0368 /ASSEMBLY_ACC=CAM_ASM_000363 /LENGTH=69 /DNA_ID=CAMNT_0018885979 /DNA_START=87 /DNA_END=293 /DNA_ORIENTATION=+
MTYLQLNGSEISSSLACFTQARQLSKSRIKLVLEIMGTLTSANLASVKNRLSACPRDPAKMKSDVAAQY